MVNASFPTHCSSQNPKPFRVCSHQESSLVRLFDPDQKHFYLLFIAVCFHIVLLDNAAADDHCSHWTAATKMGHSKDQKKIL